MAFNDVTLWPGAIDSFPSLQDNTGPSVAETEILYAEHPNKLRSAINVMQSYWTGTTVASSNGTIRGIAYPGVLFVDIWSLFQLVAPMFAAYHQPNTDQVFPGNVLPFEFVYTYSQDNYEQWTINGYYLALQTPPDHTFFERMVNGGMDMTINKPLASVSVQHMPDTPGFLEGDNSGLLVNAYCMQSTETLVVRGCLIDTDWGSPTYMLDQRWLQYEGHYLMCAINGFKVV